MFRESQQIGRYTLIRKLGEGGFGEVWLAENRTQSPIEKVAIKLPRKEQIDFSAVKEEIFNWTISGKHKNILPIIECEVFNNQIAIVSEYAPDGSLQDLIDKKGSLPVAEAVEIIIGILDGLAHLHNRKIIHRDLKPDNVLFQGKIPRLTDFGISRAMPINSQSQTISGTPAYMALECFDGKRNAQTDIWAIGVILYQILTGNLPFPQRTKEELILALVMKEPAPLSNNIPLPLQKIVMKALEKGVTKRYQTAHDIVKDLRQFLLEPLLKIPIPIKDNPDSIINTWLIPFRKGDKFGYCDKNKKIIIHPKYTNSYPFSEGVGVVEFNGKYGVIDKTGREVVSPQYYKVSSFSEGLAFVELNHKYGYIDKTGKEVIPLEYDGSDSFSEGLAFVRLNGKYGYIDKTGKEVIPIKYDVADSFSEGFARVRLNDKWGYIDKADKEVIPIKYDRASSFSEGVAIVGLKLKVGWLSYEVKYGLIDKTGKEITAFKYESTTYFSHELARVTLKDKGFYIDKNGTEYYEP